MRLFVAVRPSSEAIAHLERAVAELAELEEVNDFWRWSPSEQWHITLAFLGDVEPKILPDLTTRLARAAGRHEPMFLTLERGGGFGSARQARVLWAGVGGDRGPLRELSRSVSAGARRAGIPIEDGKFTPHVTLARIKLVTDVRPAVTVLGEYFGPGWIAGEMSLIRSRLGEGAGRRARYETVETWVLG